MGMAKRLCIAKHCHLLDISKMTIEDAKAKAESLKNEANALFKGMALVGNGAAICFLCII